MRTTGRNEYIQAMELLNSRWFSDRDENEKKLYFKFLIDAIKRDMAAEPVLEVFLSDNIYMDLNPFPEMYFKTEKGDGLILPEKCEVDMSKSTIISHVYDHEKLSRAVVDIKRNGFISDDNINGIYIREIDAAFITNGFHHSFTGASLKIGSFDAYLFDFNGLLSKYTSDGDFWIDTVTKSKSYYVQDFRIPVICEFYRYL